MLVLKRHSQGMVCCHPYLVFGPSTQVGMIQVKMARVQRGSGTSLSRRSEPYPVQQGSPSQVDSEPEQEPGILRTYAYCRGNRPSDIISLYSGCWVSYKGGPLQGEWHIHPRDESGCEWLEIWFHSRPHLYPPRCHWFKRLPFTTSYRLEFQDAEFTAYLIPMNFDINDNVDDTPGDPA